MMLRSYLHIFLAIFLFLTSARLHAETRPLLIILIDKSKSMEGKAISESKQAVERFLQQNQSSFRLRLGGFDQTVFVVFNSNIPDHKQNAIKRLKYIFPSGVADISEAFEDTLDFINKEKTSAKIILISDGSIKWKGDEEVYFLKQIRKTNSFISTIAVSQIDVPLLQDIAAVGGGEYYKANDAGTISKAITSIVLGSKKNRGK